MISITKGKTIHAHKASEALNACANINPIIRGALCDPKLGTPENHPNAKFFEEAEWYLTCRQVAHAGDTINTYCQNILAEVIMADHSSWSLLQKKNFRAKSPEEAIEKLKIQAENDSSVRKALRDCLKVSWYNEIEIIVELRNIIVHQAGSDPNGRVAKVMSDFPLGKQFLPPEGLDPNEFPVEVDESGMLVIDAKTAHWATEHVRRFIHMLDQELCHRYALPRRKQPTAKISFFMGQRSHAASIAPGVPLPHSKRKTLKAVPNNLILPEFNECKYMTNAEEIACAEKWQKIRIEIHEFVQSTCNQMSVQIQGVNASLPGLLQSHTIEGHDHHLGYDLSNPANPNDKNQFLGIRLRQKDFTPYITIWSTYTQMRDYKPCELSDLLKSHIEDCIGHAISR